MTRPYSRVYWDLVDDPMFAEVYGNVAAFGTWCQLLMIADALYPASAPLPRKTYVVRLLLESGLIQERPGNRYVIRGLEGERERRSAIGRNAAAVRYQSVSSANPMPRRDETRRDEKVAANASPTNGASGNFMGFPPKASIEDVERQHDAGFQLCVDCGVRRGAHKADHAFASAS